MVRDKNNKFLTIGDRVTVKCEVTGVSLGEESSNLTIQTLIPEVIGASNPGASKVTIVLSSSQVEKVGE